MENKRKRITQTKERINVENYEIIELKDDFRCMVWNHGTPKYVHFSSEEAMIEGIRLCKKQGKRVLVLNALYEIKPKK